MDFEVLQDFAILLSVADHLSSLTSTSHKTSLPFQPPPAMIPCDREGERGEKAMDPVPDSSPLRTCRHSPLRASKSFTVESCPPLCPVSAKRAVDTHAATIIRPSRLIGLQSSVFIRLLSIPLSTT